MSRGRTDLIQFLYDQDSSTLQPKTPVAMVTLIKVYLQVACHTTAVIFY